MLQHIGIEKRLLTKVSTPPEQNQTGVAFAEHKPLLPRSRLENRGSVPQGIPCVRYGDSFFSGLQIYKLNEWMKMVFYPKLLPEKTFSNKSIIVSLLEFTFVYL